MRKQFIETDDRAAAEIAAPWAAEIIEAEGGFWAFESPDEAESWAAQD